MEALFVKKFFDFLLQALSEEHPGEFYFSQDLRQMMTRTVPEFVSNVKTHDIVYLMYRLKLNVLGFPDPVDGKIRHTPATLIPFGLELLANRWDVIKDTPEDYTRCSVNQNQPYLTFVKLLVNFALNSVEYEPPLEVSMRQWLKPFSTGNNKKKPNIYALLIPTLTQTHDPISRDMISNSDFHTLILSQDETSLFSLKNSQDSFNRGEGFFNLDVFPSRLFTPLEKKRIKQKPRKFWPSAMLYTDYIVTEKDPAPALDVTTKNTISSMLDRAEAVESEPNLSFAAFKQKYRIEKKSLTSQDIEYLWDAYAAKYRDEDRMACQLRDPKLRNEAEEERLRDEEVKRLKILFHANLDTSGTAQSDTTLRFLVLKARQAEIMTITAEMLVYCDVLKQENPDEYQRLMNQVLCDGKTQPKTFQYVLKYVPDGIDCSTVALRSELSRLFKPYQQQEMNAVRSECLDKSSPIPVPSSGGGFFSFFYPSFREPQSVTDKIAYSPERTGYII